MRNIRVFGNTFAHNNKKKCKIIVNNHLEELKEFNNDKYINNEFIQIKLISLENIDDLSEMFYDCKYLTNINYIYKLKIKNITNMDFYIKEYFMIVSH